MTYLFEKNALEEENMYAFSVDNETMRVRIEQTVADTKAGTLDMGFDIALEIEALPKSVVEEVME